MVRPLRKRHGFMWLIVGAFALAALAWGVLGRTELTPTPAPEVTR